MQNFLRRDALQAKFDVQPPFIWLLAVNKLISATIGRCDKKATATVTAVTPLSLSMAFRVVSDDQFGDDCSL